MRRPGERGPRDEVTRAPARILNARIGRCLFKRDVGGVFGEKVCEYWIRGVLDAFLFSIVGGVVRILEV